MITIFPCGSWRSKGVPSDTGGFLRLLAGELGTPNLAKSFAYGKTHTKFYYTARQICTKDVWKRAILRTDVLSHQISSPLPRNHPQNPILGDISMQNLLCREFSVSRTLMELRSWNLQLYRYGQVLRGVSILASGTKKFSARWRPVAQGPLM